mmetsp:Transcript_13083/g.30454  ORF Transcript_13083/g.30454 Transcript_13083/m.30454 type:complete len:248 (-) Transcript_13083:52-795(-)
MLDLFGIPIRIGVESRVHGDEGLVVKRLDRAEGEFIGYVAEGVFEFTCHLVQSCQTRDGEERQGTAQPGFIGVLVHQEGHREYHANDVKHRELGVREGERNPHDFSGVVVGDHSVTQKLNDTRDNGRADLSGASGKMFSHDEFTQPLPAQLCLGVGTTCHLKEANFVVRNTPNNGQGAGCIVLGPGFGCSIGTRQKLELVGPAPLDRVHVRGICLRPGSTGFVNIKRRLGTIDIISQCCKCNGGKER